MTPTCENMLRYVHVHCDFSIEDRTSSIVCNALNDNITAFLQQLFKFIQRESSAHCFFLIMVVHRCHFATAVVFCVFVIASVAVTRCCC